MMHIQFIIWLMVYLWPNYLTIGFSKIKCFVYFFSNKNKSNIYYQRQIKKGYDTIICVGLLFCCHWGHHLNIFNLFTTSTVCFHPNQRCRPNVNMPVECVSANNSEEMHFKSPLVAFWSPELCLQTLKLGRFVMARGAGNERDRNAPWKSDSKCALLNLSGT